MASKNDEMTQGYGSIAVPSGVGFEVEDRPLQENGFHNHHHDSMHLARKYLTVRKVIGYVAMLALLFVVYMLAFPFGGGIHGGESTPVYGSRESAKPRYYRQQKVDHYDPQNTRTYPQRYFEERQFFGGPGSPIFIIMGGEDPVDAILYPFISENLGKLFSAYTACLEHRFYGESQPVQHHPNHILRQLLLPEQALADAAQFIKFKRQELGCSDDSSSSTYCPVMTVGASYPGFLAALMRLEYPELVDIGYASSAPLHLYSHDVNQDAYYEKITTVAEEASPGCADAVRQTLEEAVQDMVNHTATSKMLNVQQLAKKYGICPRTIPPYISTPEILAQEVAMVVANHFAENDMGYYPPDPSQDLILGCQAFQAPAASSAEKVRSFLLIRDLTSSCFDLRSELPPGPRGTISASDWSGVGSGPSGWMWDFQSCYLLPECGFSEESMFPKRKWTWEWMTHHCQSRFGVTPQRSYLVDRFHFTNLTEVTRLLFTNGLKDGWSVASILEGMPSPYGVKTINMENGAHHSDLTHTGPSESDTDDVKQAHRDIRALVSLWLEDVGKQSLSRPRVSHSNPSSFLDR